VVEITNFIFAWYFFIKITYLGKYCSGNGPPNTPRACQIVDNLTCTRDITNDSHSLDQSDLRNWSIRTNHACFKKIAAEIFTIYRRIAYNKLF
jgi:hypothetical protein